MLTVLRLGHRVMRDARITTHCGLVARAFGADKMIYSGAKDKKMEESIMDIVNRFGGKFTVRYESNWRKVIKNFKGLKVHLTVYGLPVEKQISRIKDKEVLLIIGGEKVPPEVYQEADYNISVTSQPHSEVAALAIFLDRYFKGKELSKKFKGKTRIIPQEKGKKVIEG